MPHFAPCRAAAAALALLGALAVPAARAAAEAPATARPFHDPLAVPAQASPLAARGLLQGVARAGQRLVAVGQRGHIVWSDDGGASWRQARVPVSADLTAVRFVDAERGWAVGHDGVVLHSADGGQTWVLQLDGRRANQRLVEHLEARQRAEPGEPTLGPLLEEARRNLAQGPDKPFLDLWFDDARHGVIVGAYNLVFRTSDGGASWVPWFDRTDNPRLLNLYAVGRAGGALWIAGEGGLVLKLDEAAQRFRARPTPYKGSFFGLVAGAGTVLAIGLRGTALASDDGGASWRPVDAGLPATLVAGTTLPDGRLLLADAGGRLALGNARAQRFQRVAGAPAQPLAGLVAADAGRVVLVGPRGAAVAALPPR